MISIQNISKNFGETKAVENLSWEIKPGKVIGLLGPNGAGKTTTMRMITGFFEPDEGTIKVDGKDITKNPLNGQKKLGYLPENNPLYEDMLVFEFLDLAARLKGVEKKKIQDEIKKVANEVDITHVIYKPIAELSKGFRQRVGLAQALLANPEILVLDEPSEGLDPNQRIEIRELIKKLAQNHTVILSTHVLGEVEATCDHVLIMKNGKKISEGSVEEIMHHIKGKQLISIEAIGDDVDVKIKEMTEVENVEVRKQDGGKWHIDITLNTEEDARPNIFKKVKDEGWTLLEMFRKKANLEDIFRELTK